MGIEHLSHEAGLLRAAVVGAPGRAVPTCPRWTTLDLLAHMTGLYSWVTAAIDERPRPPSSRPGHQLADVEDLVGRFDTTLSGLVERLRSVGPDEPVWNWVGDPTASTWIRRMVNETAVHGWDARRVETEKPEPIDSAIASDAIDEVLGVFAPQRYAGWSEQVRSHSGPFANTPLPQGEVVIAATDSDACWSVRVTSEGYDFQRDASPSDSPVAATSSDLLLALRGRVELDQDTGRMAFLRPLYP